MIYGFKCNLKFATQCDRPSHLSLSSVWSIRSLGDVLQIGSILKSMSLTLERDSEPVALSCPSLWHVLAATRYQLLGYQSTPNVHHSNLVSVFGLRPSQEYEFILIVSI